MADQDALEAQPRAKEPFESVQIQLTIRRCPYCPAFIGRIVGRGGRPRATCGTRECWLNHRRQLHALTFRRRFCWGCGSELVQPRNGRPRVLCGKPACRALRKRYVRLFPGEED